MTREDIKNKLFEAANINGQSTIAILDTKNDLIIPEDPDFKNRREEIKKWLIDEKTKKDDDREKLKKEAQARIDEKKRIKEEKAKKAKEAAEKRKKEGKGPAPTLTFDTSSRMNDHILEEEDTILKITSQDDFSYKCIQKIEETGKTRFKVKVLGCRNTVSIGVTSTHSNEAYRWTFGSSGRITDYYIDNRYYGSSYGTGDLIECEVDRDAGILNFYKNGEPLGQAFENEKFKNAELWPFFQMIDSDIKLEGLNVVGDKKKKSEEDPDEKLAKEEIVWPDYEALAEKEVDQYNHVG